MKHETSQPHLIPESLDRERALLAQCFERLSDLEKKLAPVMRAPVKPMANISCPESANVLEIIETYNREIEALFGRIDYIRESVQL
jgi:hypothetical protein